MQNIVSSADSTGSFWGRLQVEGRALEFRAYTVTTNWINIGTYYPPDPS